MEMFKGKKVKVEVEPKRGPGRPKKARFDLEAKPLEDESLAMVGIEPSEAAGSSDMAVEAAESAEPAGVMVAAEPEDAAESAEPAGVVVVVEPQKAAALLALASVESQKAAGSLAMVAVERPSAKELAISEISLMRAEYGWLGCISGKMPPLFEPTDTDFAFSLRKSFSVAKGLRAGGGGTKADLPELYPMMRTWFEEKSAAGIYVEGNALVYQFQHLMRIYELNLKSKQ